MPEKLKEFWTSLNQLSIFNGFVLMNRKRIVIPNDAKDDILKELHVAHQGIERTKRRARETVYWPNIDKDIAQVVSSCDACRQRLPSQPKEEMLEDEQEPTKPFECVGADLFTIGGKEYLAYIDRLSGWPVVHAFNKAGITTADVIKPIRKTFMDHGIPKIFESDNGPQFSSTGFQSFLKEWRIKWRSSSPYYPQSNGLAENGVKKLKAMVIKIIEERGHLDEDVLTRAMIELRNTPGPFGVSPATVVYGYELRSLLPVIERRDVEAVKRKEYYDKGSHELKQLDVEDKVIVQHEETKRWDRKGKVVEKGDHRKYLIELQSGRKIWRNRRFLRLDNRMESPHQPMEKKRVRFQEEKGTRRSERIKNKLI